MFSHSVILLGPVHLSATHPLTEILHGLFLWPITCRVMPLVQTLVQLPSIYSG